MLPAVLAQDWQLKSGSLLLPSLSTDPLLVRKSCWLRGKATQSQLQNKSDNCILGTIVMHLPNTIQFKSSHQTFSTGECAQLGMRQLFPGYILCPMYSQLHKVGLLMWSLVQVKGLAMKWMKPIIPLVWLLAWGTYKGTFWLGISLNHYTNPSMPCC